MPYQPGDILLDKYRIEAPLGQGAFGDVYLATHLKLNVHRALKILRRDAPGVGSTEFNDGKARFQLEARLGAQLNTPNPHPNLLLVHNFEEQADLLLLEMEYASGGNLAERLHKARAQEQPIPIEEALQIGLDIASALAALHARDIVHRDIKPSNILFDSKGHAKLADLGLAQIPGGPSLRSQLSNPLPHPGTPAYMSPEQELSGSYLTPASDIYALGVTLFETLTGRAYRSQRPGTRARTLRAEIPAVVDDLLLRMLATDANARPWSGKECADLLRAVLAKSAAPLPRPKKVHPAWALTVVLPVFCVLVATGAIFLVWQGSKGTAAPTQNTPAPTETVDNTTSNTPSKTLTTIAPTDISATSTPVAITTTTLGIGSSLTREKDGMVMLYVPAGPFTMGSNKGYVAEKPAHIVTLDAFWIDKTEVTNAMYALCVQAGGCTPPSSVFSHGYNAYSPDTIINRYYGNADYANYPVIFVGWNQAKRYCAWAGAALPSEAQWEKAARGTDQRTYPWGEGIDQNRANYNGPDTSAVGSYENGASPYGALDMAGNVWEWVADWYGATYYQSSPASNPGGPVLGQWRVLRGGSWFGGLQNFVGSADRSYNTSDAATDHTGFRCARSQ